ncbi:MAG: copper chaperone PCu(A)C [Rhodanobacteraceae bacterium]|nr:MAG: copper chaperone PCu(A)C [Rhodanobacteraceae bacterium]
MTPHSVLAAALLAIAPAALAASPAAPTGVTVTHAWIRWLPAGLPAAGYATLSNSNAVPVTLSGASSTAYRSVTLMRSRLAEDDSSMVKVPDISVPAHGSVKLAPGGYHLMLAGATRPLRPGDSVPMRLNIAGGTLQVDFSVLPANSTGPAD